MPIQIQLTFHERDLLLKLISMETEIFDRLKHAMPQRDTIVINVDEDELEVLLGAIVAEANHVANSKLGKELNGLFHRLDEILQTHLSA